MPQLVENLVTYYEGRITYWELWNEQNLTLPNTNPPQPSPIHIAPDLYADLLIETYPRAKAANPDAQFIFGGLTSAWGDSLQYFNAFYEAVGEYRGLNPTLNIEVLDYLALHPYTDGFRGLAPEVYMRAVEEPQYNTLFDPFLETATGFGDGGKRMWITEIGWMNFDPDSPTHPDCMNHVVVSEEQQAEYVTQAFDFMLNPKNVSLWNQPGQAAIEKVMWYQFMDVGLEVNSGCISSGAIPANPAYLHLHGRQYSGDWLLANQLPTADTEVINWWYGLVDGNMQRRKPAACAFLAYPQTCEEFYSQHIFLPLIRK